MRRRVIVLLLVLAGALLLVAAPILYVRVNNGLDLLTGDDPQFAPLRARYPNLDIAQLPKSSLYAVTDAKAGLTAYMLVERDRPGLEESRHPVPVEIRPSRCDRSRLPDWLPAVDGARDWVCVRAQGRLGTRWHVSFSVAPDQLQDACEFYHRTLDTIPGLSGGWGTMVSEPGERPDWLGLMDYSDPDTRRVVKGICYLDRWAGIFVITFTFTGGQAS